MTIMELEVFGTETNAGIVRMPGRRFPGIVIQGDSLKNLLDTAHRITELARTTEMSELIDEAKSLEEMLADYLHTYESTLEGHGHALPYFR